MKIILLIEDKVEEMAEAKKILTEKGCRFVSADNLEDAMRIWKKLEDKIDGVLTDLHFPERTGQKEGSCGFAIVTRAVRMKIPVSICTDVDVHFCGHVKNFVEDIEMLSCQKVSSTMNKDWQQAIQRLMED
jgi:hypothetical protein